MKREDEIRSLLMSEHDLKLLANECADIIKYTVSKDWISAYKQLQSGAELLWRLRNQNTAKGFDESTGAFKT
jgi:hypothetical protein